MDKNFIYFLFRFNLINPKFQRLFTDIKMKAAETVFNNADFNYQLLKNALEKVVEEQKIKKEISDKYDSDHSDKWKLDLNFKSKKGFVTISSLLVFISLIIIFAHYMLYTKNKNHFNK